MPNRILRDGILTSERVDALASWASEVFYRRLHSIVDDFGRYYGNPSLIRAAAYPLKLDKVSNADVDKWLADCAGAGLVSTYEVEGKRYLQLQDFRQHARATASKFPDMPVGCSASAVQVQRTRDAPAPVVVGVVGNEGETPGALALPGWLDQEKWKAWVKIRPAKARTPESLKAALEKLERFRAAGHDGNAIVENSLSNGWQGLFEPEAKKNGAPHKAVPDRPSIKCEDCGNRAFMWTGRKCEPCHRKYMGMADAA